MTNFLKVFEIVVTCVSPIVVAWFGLMSNRNEKQTKKYIETQEQLRLAKEKLAEKDREDLQNHLTSLDTSIKQISTQVNKIEQTIATISDIDKRIDNLIKMSAINFEFCTTLSNTLTSIGTAIEASDVIDSDSIQLDEHKRKEQELIHRAVKIIY